MPLPWRSLTVQFQKQIADLRRWMGKAAVHGEGQYPPHYGGMSRRRRESGFQARYAMQADPRTGLREQRTGLRKSGAGSKTQHAHDRAADEPPADAAGDEHEFHEMPPRQNDFHANEPTAWRSLSRSLFSTGHANIWKQRHVHESTGLNRAFRVVARSGDRTFRGFWPPACGARNDGSVQQLATPRHVGRASRPARCESGRS